MGKKTKKRLSCFLCAMLLFVTGIETSAFTGVFAATARKIDVWDFGAVQESDTQLYNNHISAQDWEQCENVSSAGKFAEGTTVFGDLTLTHTVNDRLFSTSSKIMEPMHLRNGLCRWIYRRWDVLLQRYRW